jgi:hypothetical protein
MLDLALAAAIAVVQVLITLYVTIVSIKKQRLKIGLIVGCLGLITIALTVATVYRSLQVQAEAQKQSIGFTTGGESFAVAKLYAITGNVAHLLFKQSGDYPLHQVTAIFDDLDK